MNIHAIVLCGGKAKRLGVISRNFPKCLLEINKKPFIFYFLDNLIESGIMKITLCTGYLHEEIERVVGHSYRSTTIDYSREFSSLGTGGAVKKACKNDQKEWRLILNGDSFCPFNLNSQRFIQKKSPLIFVHKVNDISRYGEIKFNDNHLIVSFEEKNNKTHGGFINAGIYWLPSNVFNSHPSDTFISMEREILPSLIGKLHAEICDRGFIDIGTPESYREAEDFFAIYDNIKL